MKKTGSSILQSLTIQEWVLMALLAAANGVVTTLLAYLNKMLNVWGGPILTSTIVGVYVVYGLLAMYIIRKPGAALFTYAIGALIQIMLGISYGAWSAIAAAVCYAIVAEPLFLMYKYQRLTWGRMMFIGTALVPLWFVVAAFMFGYTAFAPSVLVITLVIRCVSGMLLCGALTKWLGDLLAKSRYVRSFAISQDQRAA